MERHLYDNVAEDILYYEADLEAYRTDTFTGYEAFPKPDGYKVFGYLPYPYMNIEPATGSAAAEADSSDSIPLWVWFGIAAAIVAGALIVSRIRRGREDDRI
jgi:hypothetical protein